MGLPSVHKIYCLIDIFFVAMAGKLCGKINFKKTNICYLQHTQFGIFDVQNANAPRRMEHSRKTF